MKIHAVRTKKGCYITDNPHADRWHTSKLNGLLFDGEKPQPTYHKSWFFISKPPDRVERLVAQPDTSHRFELIDETMASDRVAPVLDYGTAVDEEGDWCSEFAHLESLYRFVSDPQPDKLALVEFSFGVGAEFDDIVEFNGFSYPAQTGQYRSDGMGKITQEHVEHQLLDRILFPSIVLPSRPSKLSSEQSYQIVREYIKQHIDPNVAEITSDYNFCFTVKKRIALRKPYTQQVEILTARGKSYKNKRWRKRYVVKRRVEVFEMTWSPRNYQDYTPIEGFRGENWEDLEAKINTYCEELIELINTPLKDCPTCEGMGVVEEEQCHATELPTESLRKPSR